MLSPSVENLVAQLTRLPGIGSRTAQRLAFHILQTQKDEALALAGAIEEVKERVRFCRECGNLTEEETCGICRDARRDHTTICVVEQPVDVVSLERTHAYHGLYHVLGGALSPIDGVDPSDLRIDELIRRVEANGVTEVVLATNPTMTGEATAAYLADRLRERVTVTATAGGEIKQIEIDPKAIDPSDPELLGDLVTAAVNEALRNGQALLSAKLGEAIPPGLGGLLPGM